MRKTIAIAVTALAAGVFSASAFADEEIFNWRIESNQPAMSTQPNMSPVMNLNETCAASDEIYTCASEQDYTPSDYNNEPTDYNAAHYNLS